MTRFNIQRFGRVLKWSAVMTRKEILTNTAAMFFAMLVPFIVQMLGSYGHSTLHVAAQLSSALQFCIVIYTIVVTIGGCWIFNNMKTKEQRITFRMLPAGDLEKFVARALYVTVVWWAMGMVAFCLADVFRMLISLMSGIEVVKSVIPDFFSQLFGGADVRFADVEGAEGLSMAGCVALALTWSLWIHSFYVLGGALFRRRQFVLTSLVHFAFGMISLPVIVHFVDGIDKETVYTLINVWTWVAAAFFAAWFVADWWLAYRIFRRMQVVNNKWLNL